MERAELIEKWLEALESKKYSQGRGVLVRGLSDGKPKYCCLGVLCDVIAENHVRKIDMVKLDRNSQGGLPNSVAKLVGLDNLGEFKSPVTYKGREYINLAQMNDWGIRFKTIARIIREQLAAKNFRKVG